LLNALFVTREEIENQDMIKIRPSN
jgi:hypothetical protein